MGTSLGSIYLIASTTSTHEKRKGDKKKCKNKIFAQKRKLELMHEEDSLFIKTNASLLK